MDGRMTRYNFCCASLLCRVDNAGRVISRNNIGMKGVICEDAARLLRRCDGYKKF